MVDPQAVSAAVGEFAEEFCLGRSSMFLQARYARW